MSGSGESIRVTLVGPSLDILGGQAVQASRLLARLRECPELRVEFLPINPRLPQPLGLLQRVRYLRTVVTSVAYAATLVWRLPRTRVVHAYSASYWSFLLAPAPCILLGRCFGRTVVLNYHSGEAEDHLRRWGWLVIPIMRLAHRIVVQSPYLVEVFQRFGLAATAIPNHVDAAPTVARPHHPGKPRLLSNRNLEPMYGVDTVLRAFAIIQRRYPEAELVVAGQGSQRERLEQLGKELGLRQLRFAGAVEPTAMRAWYDWSDLYLNASLIDNMPLSILEASASGVPTVSTDAGGIPWIVRHGEDGLLVPCGDAAALAEAALRLLDDPVLAAQLGTRARARVQELYSWPAVERQWLELYRALAGRGD